MRLARWLTPSGGALARQAALGEPFLDAPRALQLQQEMRAELLAHVDAAASERGGAASCAAAQLSAGAKRELRAAMQAHYDGQLRSAPPAARGGAERPGAGPVCSGTRLELEALSMSLDSVLRHLGSAAMSPARHRPKPCHARRAVGMRTTLSHH